MAVLEALFILTYFCSTKARNVSELHVEWDYSAYDENFPFFSDEFDARLRAWNETLLNVSRYCAKLNASGTKTIILRIWFPAFDTNVDRSEDFLTLETFHPVLVRQKSRHGDLATIAYLSILELWPLLVLCFSCAALAGMIIWVLVSIIDIIYMLCNILIDCMI